jgi:Bacterial PH domain
MSHNESGQPTPESIGAPTDRVIARQWLGLARSVCFLFFGACLCALVSWGVIGGAGSGGVSLLDVLLFAFIVAVGLGLLAASVQLLRCRVVVASSGVEVRNPRETRYFTLADVVGFETNPRVGRTYLETRAGELYECQGLRTSVWFPIKARRSLVDELNQALSTSGPATAG